MFHYFGYGSNMNLISLRAKGVEPSSSQHAVLPGWCLCFNVQHFFRHEGGVGNIQPSSAKDQVYGILYDCPDQYLEPLDATEACGFGYHRATVDVLTKEKTVSAYTYIGMPDFVDDSCLPSRRYLNILIEGARQAGLDPNFIHSLTKQAVHQAKEYPPFTPPSGDFPLFHSETLSQHPLYTGLYGSVFDMSSARSLHDYLKSFFGGRDMTLFHLKRLDSSNGCETIEDIRQGRLNTSQRRYLNDYLNEYAREYRYIGKINYD
ncbi:MAG: gamma-glutamylcyclotransferase [Candidatus Thiodiazotropha lotti]|nr:gamma-glutamylcyclotransferase [Candidatus Thiodiazotropha lotti]MCW4193562.1 gamma-glutamylcyclotransferase [Candidatus Thiodiazotropha weberae]